MTTNKKHQRQIVDLSGQFCFWLSTRLYKYKALYQNL